MHNGDFIVSSGLYGQSFVARLDAKMTMVGGIKLPKHYFAEGLTFIDDHIYLLTWKAGTLLKLDKDLQLVSSYRYDGEGWGLAYNGQHLLMSDGSARIQFRDPTDFSVVKTLDVRFNGEALSNINELEYAQGALWANVWHSDRIYKISPETGEVLGDWDLSGLRQNENALSREAVLNGIAYDKNKNAFWVTGKLWQRQYLVKLHLNEPSSID